MKIDLTEFEEGFDLPVDKWQARDRKIQKRLKSKEPREKQEQPKEIKEKPLTKPSR